MEESIKLGRYNHLRVIKQVEFGMYLDGGLDEILIPNSYIPEGTKVDDYIDVFLYRDSEDRIIATTWKPFAQVGEFAYLKAKQVNDKGVFLDWGLVKDLMVPFGQQSHKMVEGRSYLVYVYIDEQTDRIVASAKIEKFFPLFEDQAENLAEGERVEVIPFQATELGYKCLINNCKIGLLFKNKVFTKINLGEKINVYISKIREDGKIDLSLQLEHFSRMSTQTEVVLNALKNNNGILYLHDKSPSEDIQHQLSMSKKDFKKAIGILYKNKQIKIDSDKIFLL
ncbi:MAG: hypothetical protein RIR51_2141 [Bacteroidota bacterium]|jgi:predicted RNA-binding protein (virulence factor B family)